MLIRLLLLLLAVADSPDFTQQLDVHAQCRDWPDCVGECKLVRGIAALATALGSWSQLQNLSFRVTHGRTVPSLCSLAVLRTRMDRFRDKTFDEELPSQ